MYSGKCKNHYKSYKQEDVPYFAVYNVHFFPKKYFVKWYLRVIHKN